MKETEANTEVVRSLIYAGWEAHKLSDVTGSRFTARKPCDILACSPNGEYCAIETKIMTKWEKFDATWLRPNQVIHLNSVAKKNGLAFVLLRIAIKGDRKNKIEPIHTLIAFEWHHPQVLKKGLTAKELQLMQDNKLKKIGRWLKSYQTDSSGKRFWDINFILG